MNLAKSSALFMHVFQLGRGEEVTDEVIDGKQSIVWTQALNRVHVQKSIINWCLIKVLVEDYRFRFLNTITMLYLFR
jgi:ornithine carbamoyltransferase